MKFSDRRVESVITSLLKPQLKTSTLPLPETYFLFYESLVLNNGIEKRGNLCKSIVSNLLHKYKMSGA